MAKIVWNEETKRVFETGVDHGVLYMKGANSTAFDTGVPWSGLINITESPSGAEPQPMYADNIKYGNPMSDEEFAGSIEAYTYPDEFTICDGSVELADGVFLKQQQRVPFCLSYRTLIKNADGSDKGYKIHLVYNAIASPSEQSHDTINETPEAMTFSWDFTTTPVEVTGYKPTAHVVIDSTKADDELLEALETILYGETNTEPRIPLPDELKTLMTPTPPTNP
jgi:hypothetical protein